MKLNNQIKTEEFVRLAGSCLYVLSLLVYVFWFSVVQNIFSDSTTSWVGIHNLNLNPFYIDIFLVIILLPMSYFISYITRKIQNKRTSDKNHHSPKLFKHSRSITYNRNTGYKFQLDSWGENDRLVQRLVAAKGTWLDQDSLWRLINVNVREFHEDGSESFKFVNRIDTVLSMRLEDFAQRNAIVKTMTTHELSKHIEQVRSKGAPVSKLVLERHSRTSTPFAIFVLTFIGVGIASRKQRGGIGVHLFVAVLIGFTFVFASRIITVYAATAPVPAWFPRGIDGVQFLAAWLPNILFTLLGFFIYKKAPK